MKWRDAFPDIPWDEPLEVTVFREGGGSKTVFACRYCVAEVGLKAQDVLHHVPGLAVWEEPDGFIEHLATVHGG